jgi:hypothetical protein
MGYGTREYGRDRLNVVLRNPAHPLFADANASCFVGAATWAGGVFANEELLRQGAQGNIGPAFQKTVPDIISQSPPFTVEGIAVPVTPEPVLILKVKWRLANGDYRLEYLSDADRLFANNQAFGYVKEMGDFRRGVSADHAAQRTTCVLALSNVDGHFDRALMDKEWTGATVSVLIGFAHMRAGEFLNPIDFYIDRFEELKPGVVTMSLIDAIDDPLGENKLIKPPKLAFLSNHKWSLSTDYERNFTDVPSWSSGWADKGFGSLQALPAIKFNKQTTPNGYKYEVVGADTPAFMDEEVQETRIPMPLGEDAFYKAPFIWARDPISGPADGQSHNPVLVVVLGCSKYSDAFGLDDHEWSPGEDFILYGRKTDFPTGAEKSTPVFTPLYEPGNNDCLLPSGFLSYYGAHARVRVATIEDTDWSTENPYEPKQYWKVAYLFVVLDSGIFDTNSTPGWYRDEVKAALAHLQAGAYVRAPEGAQGKTGNLLFSGLGSEYRATPAGIIEYLLHYFNGVGVPPVTKEALLDLHQSPTSKLATVAAVIDSDTATIDAINGLCQAHQINLVHAPQRGGYLFVAESPSPGDLAKMRSADGFDESAMLANSFSISSPVGDELHGFCNRFKVEGLREPFAELADLGEDKYFVAQEALVAARWRVYEREVNLAFIAGFNMAGRGAAYTKLLSIVSRYTRQENTVKFSTSLRGLGYEVGDFLYVSHARAGRPSASPRGWSRRLCRIDAVTYSWRQKQILFELVDRDEWDTRRVYFLDDELNWVFKKAAPDTAVTLVPGSADVFCGNWSPLAEGVVAGMILATVSTQDFLCRHFRIDSVEEDFLILAEPVPSLDDEEGELVPEGIQDFKILYGHTVPPPSGIYSARALGPNDYGRLCDGTESQDTGELGFFSDGSTGYTLSG